MIIATRSCPACGKEITYSSRHKYEVAKAQARTCKGCSLKAFYADPATRARQSQIQKESHARPEVKAKISAGSKKMWTKQGHREVMTEKLSAAWADESSGFHGEKFRTTHVELMKRQRNDPNSLMNERLRDEEVQDRRAASISAARNEAKVEAGECDETDTDSVHSRPRSWYDGA